MWFVYLYCVVISPLMYYTSVIFLGHHWKVIISLCWYHRWVIYLNHVWNIDHIFICILVYNLGIYLEMDFRNSSFQVSALMHPSTYLNKVLLGSKQGTMQLWNIRQDKMLYIYSGWDSPIVCLEQVKFTFMWQPFHPYIQLWLNPEQRKILNRFFSFFVMSLDNKWGKCSCSVNILKPTILINYRSPVYDNIH